jgi:pimeloyl-ACP methyl ester carboxylesterase
VQGSGVAYTVAPTTDASASFFSSAMNLRDLRETRHGVPDGGAPQSTRPPEMGEPAQNHPPLVRSVDAVRDIDAAVDLVRGHLGVSKVSLFGWATGGQWAGYYATLHSGKLSHLILLNALYGADARHVLMGHGLALHKSSVSTPFSYPA